MSEQNEDFDNHFFQLIFTLQAGAMQQMGKIASPITGKVERDLNLAKASIDMLDMLQRKTEGNLSPDEKRLIDHILYELRLNYVDEVKKGSQKSEKPAEEPERKEENTSDNHENKTETKDEN